MALGDGVERPRIAGALTSEGFVLEVESVSEGAGAPGRRVVRPRDPGSARRASCSRRRAARDPLAASRELRPFTDLVLIGDGDPTRAGQAFAREVAAVLPQAAARGRRAAARARQAAGRLPARAHARPAGAERLRRHQGRAARPRTPSWARRWTRWSREAQARSDDRRARRRRAGARRPGRSATTPTPTPRSSGFARARRARRAARRGAGAGRRARRWSSSTTRPSAERLARAIYGGARAYLPRAALELLGRVAASAAARRHGESLGVRIVEALAQARHPDRRRAQRARRRRTRDVDVRLIADADHAAPARRRSSRPATRCWWSTTRRSC